MQLRRKRRFVWIVDTGNVLQLAGARSAVKADRIPHLAHRQGSIDIHFNECAYALARFVASVPIWRDSCDQNDDSMPGEQIGYIRDAPDVFVAIGFGEAEIAIEMLAQIVGVKHFRAQAEFCQLRGYGPRKRTLTRRAKTGEPNRQSS
jgi:hypothetical protein